MEPLAAAENHSDAITQRALECVPKWPSLFGGTQNEMPSTANYSAVT